MDESCLPTHVCLFYESRAEWVAKNSAELGVMSRARTLAPESEVLELAHVIRDIGLGCSLIDLAVSGRHELAEVIRNGAEGTVYWNISDGDQGLSGSLVPALARLFGRPFIGSSTYVQGLANRKHHWRAFLGSRGFPVAGGASVLRPGDDITAAIATLNLPLFIKSGDLGNGSGMDRIDPVCKNYNEAKRAVSNFFELGIFPVLIEEFLSGPEYSVAIIHLDEWRTSSVQKFYSSGYVTTEIKDGFGVYSEEPADMPDLVAFALRAARDLEVKDYARLDFRADSEGMIHLIDVNTGAFLTSDTFQRCIGLMGLDFKQALKSMLAWSYHRQTAYLLR